MLLKPAQRGELPVAARTELLGLESGIPSPLFLIQPAEEQDYRRRQFLGPRLDLGRGDLADLPLTPQFLLPLLAGVTGQVDLPPPEPLAD